MSKKSLMDEIAVKVKRKEDLREEIANRHKNVETFVLKMINDLEDMELALPAAQHDLLATLSALYAASFESQIHTIDPRAKVKVQFYDGEGVPRVSGILINWSYEYQQANNCDEQLFVDATSILLKD